MVREERSGAADGEHARRSYRSTGGRLDDSTAGKTLLADSRAAYHNDKRVAEIDELH